MKNLYKIKNELYIISDTENVNENCWIITDGKLVQVSYLLSNEVARGYKVILTTNKLLIKDGVQAIDDEFLEWFLNKTNNSDKPVDIVEVIKTAPIRPFGSLYKIIIPKEEPKSHIEYINTDDFTSMIYNPQEEPKQECTCTDECLGYLTQNCKGIDEPKQETLEEAAERFVNNTRLKNPKSLFCEGAKWQQEQDKKLYSEEEVETILRSFRTELLPFGQINDFELNKFFKQFKNK
jgi:hypothetical protein